MKNNRPRKPDPKRASKIEVPRLPYSITAIESMFERERASYPLASGARIMRGTAVRFGDERLSRSNYGQLRGELLALSNNLHQVVRNLEEGQENYRDVLQEWFATLMHGIMSYNSGLRVEGGIRSLVLLSASRGIEKYRELYSKYEHIFVRSFVSEEVSADDNYEELEFLGDSAYRTALISYMWRELRIRNKSVLTFLKHKHENTKSLSDLAKILHVDALVRTKGTKHLDATLEDVFEAVVGVMQIMEWEIQRNPNEPESAQFAASGGFAIRLVRMIFENSNARYEDRVAPKTFVTSLSTAFSVGREKILETAKTDAEHQIITFRTAPAIVSQIAGTFGADQRALSKILNCRYESSTGGSHAKHFSQVVYEDIVDRLAKLGITQHSLNAYQNRVQVPVELRGAFENLTAKAKAKRLWLSVSVPKTADRTGSYEIKSMLYHDDPHRIIPKTQTTVQGEADRMNAFRELMKLTDALIDRTPAVSDVGDKIRKTMNDVFKLTAEDSESQSSVPASVSRNSTHKAPWIIDAAQTVVQHGDTSHSGIAGSATENRQFTAAEMHDAIMGARYDIIREDTLRKAEKDNDLKLTLKNRIAAPGRHISMLIRNDAGTYGHVELVRENPRRMRVFGIFDRNIIETLQGLGLPNPEYINETPLPESHIAGHLNTVISGR